MNPKVLFVLKYREIYGGYCSGTYPLASGLYNSARLVHNMLLAAGVESKLTQVVDNNEIDKEVTEYRPTHVIIEAIWVVPDKFDILQKLHPNVKWIVRSHSEIPFLANEGVAISWLADYVKRSNVIIAANSTRSLADMRLLISESYPAWTKAMVEEKVILLDNYYPVWPRQRQTKTDFSVLDVGCFGAIRPMKNQLNQAIAAIEAASEMKKPLRFHVNGTRCEQSGNNVLKNLRALLNSTGNSLIEHPWLDQAAFAALLSTMDLGMQVSFSETFNITAADMVIAGLPIVVSPEIPWATKWCHADPTNVNDMVSKINRVLDWKWKRLLHSLNVSGLTNYVYAARDHWLDFLDVDWI